MALCCAVLLSRIPLPPTTDFGEAWHARHRLALTGTPVRHDVNELNPTLTFLKLSQLYSGLIWLPHHLAVMFQVL